MKEEIKYILEQMKECDSFHNRCDYLLDHSEIDYLLEYIDNLQSQLKAREEVIKEAREYVKKEFDEYSEFVFGIELKNKILEILSKGENK